MKKTVLVTFSLIILLGVGFYFFLYPKLAIISGYNAKILCSCQFVSGLSQERAEKEDLGFSLLWLASNEIDTIHKTVISSVWGLQTKKAVYRKGLGCSIIRKGDESAFKTKTIDLDTQEYAADIFPDKIITGTPEMQKALEAAFYQDPEKTLLLTRAVLVIKDGILIGEKYAPGIDRNTPLLGWSMTKSVTSTLTGILVKRGFWNPDDPLPVDSWQNDKRKNITLKNALQQTIGLEWEEVYSSVSSATKMLYEEDNMGMYAAAFPEDHAPGTHWKYSSGTSNILANVLEKAFKTNEEYLNFPQKALFQPIGARDFTIETDASNHFVGSSYGYAPARSWAKVGLLYLNQGNWNGNQILDSSWVAATLVSAPDSEDGYGYQFWLNSGGWYKNYSTNAYWMNGYQGQQVAIHPEENMVIVRLGVTNVKKGIFEGTSNKREKNPFDFDGWTKKVIDAAKAE